MDSTKIFPEVSSESLAEVKQEAVLGRYFDKLNQY